MIKKSLIAFAIFTAIHAIIIALQPTLGMPTHQWQDNIVKAQQFLYGDHTDTAMVGTSLSARIIGDSIPFVKSVAFGGCAVEDGLRLILSNPDKPKVVLLETNLFCRDGNDDMISKVSQGIIPTIRHIIPSLREQNEPICLISGLMIKAMGLNPQAAAATVDTTILRQNIERHLTEDTSLPTDKLQERLQTITSLIKQLESEGTRFAFFEMPVNESLYHLKELEQTRQTVKQAFPNTQYTYLPNDTTTYLTTDGLHLDLEGQQRYSHFFKQALGRLKIND